MNKDNTINSNVERFSGFADIYDKYRPEPPSTVIEILLNYLQKEPSTVVDLGCGTGLSTFIWGDYAKKVIGVEPNLDMINRAKEKLEKRTDVNNVFFQQGISNNLKLESNSIDIVTCSQSFHWMEPASTLEEVARVLKVGGIFAAYDNDWPPSVDWVVENEYIKLLDKAFKIIDEMPQEEGKAKQWNKSEHLKRIKESNKFRYSKEIVFRNKEKSDADRYIGLALSQGALQTVLKKGITELDHDIEEFKQIVIERFDNKTLDLIISYRMRIGIK